MSSIVIGKIVRAHGIKGELKVYLYSQADYISNLEGVFLKNAFFRLRRARVSGNEAIVELEGVSDRTVAESFIGCEISIDKANAAPLSEGEYYVSDIIGCTVSYDYIDIGVVTDVLQYGAADVYVLKSETGTIMFPSLAKVILDTDIERKRIIVDKKSFDEVAVYEN